MITKLLMFTSFLLISFPSYSSERLEKATFAGGCFWCMEPPFEKVDGVVSVISGYSGGEVKNPTYKQVSSGNTKHIESIQVSYDPDKISYSELIKVFWKNIDPSESDGQHSSERGQFVDRGEQYSTAIFFHDDKQKEIAKKSKDFILQKKYFSKVLTDVRAFKTFYPAEEYHQDYYKKSIVTKLKYKYYRNASGRDVFINKHWKGKKLNFDSESTFVKPSKEELKRILSEVEYDVTQNEGTERPFKNRYWDNKEEGIYVDIVSGEVLFSSRDKFKSGTGWPSFTRPISKESIVEREDKSLFYTRTEVRSKLGDSHLGHVFNDGPAPTGLRYCLNSASLRFIHKKDLEKEGLGKYIKLFSNEKSH